MKLRILFILFFTICFSLSPTFSQAFLNGDFEINSCPGGVDQINLANAGYNGYMSNSFAFGTYGDMDILTTPTYWLPQSGSWYIAFTGGGSDAISLTLSAPLVAGNTYTISFWDRVYSGYNPQPVQIGVSTVNNAFGTVVYTGPMPVGVWTNRIATFVAPVSGLYITVQLGGAYSLSDWVQADNFTFVGVTNTITTGVITGSPFCPCAAVNVPFTSTGTFTAGNIYTAQLSNATGSFATPVNIGILASTANAGTIPCIIPCGTTAGTLYRIRVISSTPSVVGTDNGVNLTVSAIPTVTASASPASICAGQSSVLTGGGATTYSWNPGGLSGTSVTVTPGTTTTYTVTGTGPGGCTNTATVTVPVNPVPTVTASAAPASICAGQSSVLTGAGATTYSWNPGGLSGTSVTVTPATTTIYTVTGTGPGGCTNTATVTVTVNPVPTVTASASPAAICSGQSSVLTGSGATTYSWNPGGLSGTSVTVTPATTTTYTVTGTGAGGCTNTATVTVTVTSSVIPSISIVAVPSGPICSGTSVTFTATPTNGGTSPSYQWQVNGVNAGTNSPTFTSSTLNNGDVITVIMTSNSPCASPTTATSNAINMVVTSTVIPAVSIAAVPSGTICAGTSVTFTATPTNGGTTPGYQWQVNGVNAGTNSNTFTSSTLNSGDVITVILTSNSPCAMPTTATSNTITMVVTASVVPSVSIAAVPPGTICAGTSVTFTATPTNGGTTPGYQWQVNGVNAGTNSPTFTSNTLNNGDVITVILTSNAPCAVPTTATSNTITMTVIAAPTASITPANPSYCAGSSVVLNGAGGTTYAWSPSTGLSCTNCQSPTANPTTTTTYTLTVSNGSCTATTTVTVTVTPIPVPHITGDLTLCEGMSTTLTASGGNTYVWSTGDSTASIVIDTMLTTTSYTVTVSNGACTATATATVVVSPIPVADAGPDTTIDVGAMIQLHGSGGTTYSWTPFDALSCFNCPDPYADPEGTTTYILTVTNAAGCTDTDTITVYVNMECGDVFVPNIFTPNGDGRNDILFARGNCIKTMTFSVYDRWGEKVFESTDPGFGWDGKLRDKPMDPGIFVYCLKALLFTGDEIVKKGNVTLVR